MSNEYFSAVTPTASHSSDSETPMDLPALSTTFSVRSSGRHTPSSAIPLTPDGYSPLDGLSARHLPRSKDNMDMDHMNTQNVQSSLVSHILNLQRDRDTNLSFIEKLEEALAQAHAYNAALQEDLKKRAKENSAQQQQYHSVENTTLLALEELVEERDVARSAAEDMRDRRESLRRRLRAQKDETDLAHKLLQEERAKWEAEKRTLQLKAEVAKAKLDNVLKEVAERDLGTGEDSDQHDNEPYDDAIIVPSPLDEVSRRNSAISVATIRPSSSYHGTTLAEELAKGLEEEIEDNEDEQELLLTTQPSLDASISPSLCVSSRASLDLTENQVCQARAVRLSQTFTSDQVSTVVHTPPRNSIVGTPSRGSPRESNELQHDETRDAMKVLGNMADLRDTPIQEEESLSFDEFLAVQTPRATTPIEHKRYDYVDSGVQYSPQRAIELDIHELLSQPMTTKPRRRHSKLEDIESSVIEDLSNPLLVPEMDIRSPWASSAQPNSTQSASTQSVSTQSVSTQTDLDLRTAALNSHPPEVEREYVYVPSITVQAPSTSNSVRTSLISPVMSSMGCQTEVLDMISAGTQTDKIRIDLRGSQLPQHLKTLLSKTSAGVSEAATSKDVIGKNVIGVVEDKMLHSPSTPEILPEIVDNERWSSSAALMENDVDLFTAPAVAIPRRSDRWPRSFIPPTPVPEADNEDSSPQQKQSNNVATSFMDKTTYSLNVGARPFPARSSSLAAAGSSHRQVKHASSRDSLASNSSSVWSQSSGPPPFAIPTRRSSRGLSRTFKLDAASMTPSPTHLPAKSRGIQKSPSKAAMRRSRTGRPISGRSSIDHNRNSPPSRPRTPRRRPAARQTHSPLDGNNSFFGHYRQQSSQEVAAVTQMSKVVSQGNPDEPADAEVVDAIAAAMVGGWMWKHVKGKAFGSDDFMQDTSKSNVVRHKRWVWLSPYDRTILWSDKRPSSSAALMGKSGRKLVIESVFDVKDTAPRPKGVTVDDICDRSIIILTPNRALKFTAPTTERHHLWLTALTYISKQNSYHDSMNLDIPMFKQPAEDNATITSDHPESVTVNAAMDLSASQTSILNPAITGQTRFPFPFTNFSCTTSAAGSPARALPVRALPGGDDDTMPAPASRGFNLAPLTTSLSNTISGTSSFTFSPAPKDTPVDSSDFLDCALPPFVPRLPSSSASSIRLTKKSSSSSLRPASTRAKSSIEVSRNNSLRDGARPQPALRAATTTSCVRRDSANSGKMSIGMPTNIRKLAGPGPLSVNNSMWPDTPPRSSSSSAEADDLEASFASNTTFFDVFTHSPAAPAIRASMHTPDESIFDVAMTDGEDLERQTSADSVAPPSFRTAKGLGGKKTTGRVGRMLWR